jgi:hypothetical protein
MIRRGEKLFVLSLGFPCFPEKYRKAMLNIRMTVASEP